MDHYVRGRTWISNQHGGKDFEKRTGGKGGNFAYTEEEKETWEKDSEAYLSYRRSLEYNMQNRFGITHIDSDLQKDAKERFTADMKERLKGRPEIIDNLLPSFPPLCKRLTPGPGYLEALTNPKVNVIPTAISHVDEKGIWTEDGVHHPVDAIVCATGFNTTPGARGFPIIGRQGVNLRERYLNRPDTYLGLCTDGFPNFFQSLGPNAFQGAGNLLIMIEYTHSYVGQILSKMVHSNIGVISPKRKAVMNFTNFCEKYFERTVYSATCDSWYKSSPPGATKEECARGKVTALWPGSSLHAVKTLETVRWEDFETQPYDDNDFGWFGNGWTVAERNPTEDMEPLTWYLNNTKILTQPKKMNGLCHEIRESPPVVENGYKFDEKEIPVINGIDKAEPVTINGKEVPTSYDDLGIVV